MPKRRLTKPGYDPLARASGALHLPGGPYHQRVGRKTVRVAVRLRDDLGRFLHAYQTKYRLRVTEVLELALSLLRSHEQEADRGRKQG